MTRRCEICLEDISHRHINSKYCASCSRELQEARSIRNNKKRFERLKKEGICVFCGKRDSIEFLVSCQECRNVKTRNCVICGDIVGRNRRKYCQNHSEIISKQQFEKLTEEEMRKYEENKGVFGKNIIVKKFNETPDDDIEEMRKRILQEINHIYEEEGESAET